MKEVKVYHLKFCVLCNVNLPEMIHNQIIRFIFATNFLKNKQKNRWKIQKIIKWFLILSGMFTYISDKVETTLNDMSLFTVLFI